MRAAWNPTHRTQEYCTCTLYLIQFIVTCTINAQVQALSYTRVEVVLRHCDSHWCCFSCFPALLPSPLISAMSQAGSQEPVAACRHSREQLALCSAGCPRTAPHSVKPRQPCRRVIPSPEHSDAALLMHTSSQLQFSSRVNVGREWAWGNTYVAWSELYSKNILNLKGYSDIVLRAGCSKWFNSNNLLGKKYSNFECHTSPLTRAKYRRNKTHELQNLTIAKVRHFPNKRHKQIYR